MTQTYADLWLAAVTQKGREREGRGTRREGKVVKRGGGSRNREKWRVS